MVSGVTEESLAPSPWAVSDEWEPTQVCPHFRAAVELIGARWSGAILRALLLGRARFAEIRAVIPGLSDTMLTVRLRELEAAGVVCRSVWATSPVRVEYSLTEAGRELAPILDALVSWAHRWVDGAPPAVVHAPSPEHPDRQKSPHHRQESL
jgi:DNA-binding HxlR family transcriptional regulator